MQEISIIREIGIMDEMSEINFTGEMNILLEQTEKSNNKYALLTKSGSRWLISSRP